MQDLATGLKALGNMKVLAGIGNLALFAGAGTLAVAAIPFLTFMSLPFVGKGLKLGLKGLASGLKAFAEPEVALGAAIVAGLSLSIGASMLMLGEGVNLAATGIANLIVAIKDIPVDNLLKLGGALYIMAGGLAAMAVAALPAMPGLLALGVVATGAAALGGLFGGGAKGGENNQADVGQLVTEVKALVAQMKKSTPIVVNLDGRKVGDGTYGASTNTSSGGKTK
jgi:hypothetical protein